MPLFSVIVPAYNRSSGVKKTLKSVLSQSCPDFEIIVVDDASSDKTAHVVERFKKNDRRVKLVTHTRNMGTHKARKTGVAKAKGEYVLFLDADDELQPDALKNLEAWLAVKNCDILCARTSVHALDNNKRAQEIEDWLNHFPSANCSVDFLASAYEEPVHLAAPWNITAKVFKRDLVQSAFKASSNERLLFGEDAYELLLILSQKNASIDYADIDVYIYNLGKGITKNKRMNLDEFLSFFDTATKALLATKSSLGSNSNKLSRAKTRAYYGFRKKLLSDVLNHWSERLSIKDQLEALDIMSKSEFAPWFFSELYRRLRDEAYCLWTSAKTQYTLRDLMDFGLLMQKAEEVAWESANGTTYRSTFYRNLNDLFSKTTAKSIRYKEWREFPMVHFSERALLHLTADVTEDREVIPLALSNDATTFHALSYLFDNAQEKLPPQYFWDIVVFNSSVLETQIKKLEAKAPENVRLTFIAKPFKEDTALHKKEALELLPYNTALFIDNDQELATLDLVVSYLSCLDQKTPSKTLLLQENVVKEK